MTSTNRGSRMSDADKPCLTPHPGPGYWNWRCLECGHPIRGHLGWWRRMRLLRQSPPSRDPMTTRWLAPNDGGRGREVRTKWTRLRFFSWGYGALYRRGRRWYTYLTWHFLKVKDGLVGVYVYRDEDDDWHVEVGLWPLFTLDLMWSDWPRPLTTSDAITAEVTP